MTALAPFIRPGDRRTLVLVWLALTVGTVLAWRLTPRHAPPTTLAACVVVLIALVKCRFVLRHFMEIRYAPRWLRLATDMWLVVLWFGLLGIYLWP